MSIKILYDYYTQISYTLTLSYTQAKEWQRPLEYIK